MKTLDRVAALRGFCRPLLSPPVCEACDAMVVASPSLCAACASGLQLLRAGHCRICSLPFGTGMSEAGLCMDCLQQSPSFQRAQSALELSGSVSRLLHAFKFGACFSALAPLLDASLPSFRAAVEEFSPQALVPVPLGWWRRFRRGFNQSYVLAEGLQKASRLSLPLLTDLRRKGMPPQARRGRAERLRVMRGAFRVTRPSAFRGLRLLVVDDVLTTGATAESLGKSLLQAGAEAVQVWTLARTARKEWT